MEIGAADFSCSSWRSAFGQILVLKRTETIPYSHSTVMYYMRNLLYN